MRVHVVADVVDSDGGYVTERLTDLGAVLEPVDRDHLPTFTDLERPDLVLLLGSERSAHDPEHAAVVEAESTYVRVALALGIPVMGICYGAQLMARAFGGTSWRADQPEIGWQRVDTIDPVLCPEGPWGQMHNDVFAPGPTSRVLGTSWRGPQCFIDDAFGARSIAWQFHPEVTRETYARWVDSGYHGDSGISDSELLEQARVQEPGARNRAHALVDAALHHLGVAVPR